MILKDNLTEHDNLKINGELNANKLIIDEGYKNKKLIINFLGKNSEVTLGRNCNIQGVLTVSNNSTISIGDNFSSTGGVTILARDSCKVNIGTDCMFATSILIRTSDEHSIKDLSTGTILNFNEDVMIGDHVWICDNVLVLKGANIGSGSVIGARSVVTGKLPDNSLCAGVPARALRENILWDKLRPPKSM
jgi:acetyltransferase-like isoleucine patch superfamily enzyme